MEVSLRLSSSPGKVCGPWSCSRASGGGTGSWPPQPLVGTLWAAEPVPRPSSGLAIMPLAACGACCPVPACSAALGRPSSAAVLLAALLQKGTVSLSSSRKPSCSRGPSWLSASLAQLCAPVPSHASRGALLLALRGDCYSPPIPSQGPV